MSEYTEVLTRRIDDLGRRVAVLEGERVTVHAHLHLDNALIEDAVRKEVQGVSPWHAAISPERERQLNG